MDSESTVFVVDDDAAARESVVALVKFKGLKARGFASAEQFLAHCSPQLKGVIVADMRMTGMSGLDLLQRLKECRCNLPVIMITGYADVALAVKAMQAGTVSFLEKPCQEKELWKGIVRALEIENNRHAQRTQKAEIESRLASLKPEELDVLSRLLEGHANKRIAADLNLGLRTIELRRSKIMKKMQAESLPDLVRMAMIAGFLKSGGAG